MRGLDIRTWGLLDWIGVISFAAAALIPAINAALNDAPVLAEKMPAFLSWSYLPLSLMLITFGVILYRLRTSSEGHEGTENIRLARTRGIGNRPITGPFSVAFDPPAEFRVLPIHYAVDLTAPLPYVQASFHAVNFLPHTIVLTHARLSLRLFGAPAIEAIPMVAEDFSIEPRLAPIVMFRRNLSDSEIRNLPWKAGHELGSFELSAKATDGEKNFSYGPVSSMVIEGWISAPAKSAERQPPEPVASPPLPVLQEPSEFMPLHDGIAQIYEELKNPTHIWTILSDSHSGGDANEILDSMAGLVAGRLPIYGRQPPKTRIERLDVTEKTQVKFEGGARAMRFVRFQMPPCTDLKAKRADVEALIESQRGRYAPES